MIICDHPLLHTLTNTLIPRSGGSDQSTSNRRLHCKVILISSIFKEVSIFCELWSTYHLFSIFIVLILFLSLVQSYQIIITVTLTNLVILASKNQFFPKFGQTWYQLVTTKSTSIQINLVLFYFHIKLLFIRNKSKAFVNFSVDS